jgi:hypothetical protein
MISSSTVNLLTMNWEKYTCLIKLACIKSPDGMMIGIYESKDGNIDEDNFNPDIHGESKMDSTSAEIKNILDKFKI